VFSVVFAKESFNSLLIEVALCFNFLSYVNYIYSFRVYYFDFSILFCSYVGCLAELNMIDQLYQTKVISIIFSINSCLLYCLFTVLRILLSDDDCCERDQEAETLREVLKDQEKNTEVATRLAMVESA